jgi:hypothetical protein
MLTPSKFGTLAGLVCCEMVAHRGKSPGQQLREAFAEVGSLYRLRENFRLTAEVKGSLLRSYVPKLSAAAKQWIFE